MSGRKTSVQKTMYASKTAAPVADLGPIPTLRPITPRQIRVVAARARSHQRRVVT
jgi:hypothetical protein